MQNKSYQPSVGDRAVLHAADEKGEIVTFWVATTPAAYREMVKGDAMNDEKRGKELEAEKKLSWIQEDETSVVVVGLDSVTIPLGVRDGVAQVITADVAAVRVLDGPHKGKILYTDSDNVTRLRTVEEKTKGRRGTRKSAKPKAARTEPAATKTPGGPSKESDDARAASLFKFGQDLEKSGKTSGALEFYRKLVKQYPNTAQAKSALSRIEAIGKAPQ